MSDVPAVHSPKRHKSQPFSAEEFKLKLLRDAGIGDDRLIAVTKKVFDSAEAELEAEKETPIIDHGRLTGVHTQPDYPARARAREQLIELVGLKRGGSGDSSPGVKVEIHAPAWIRPAMTAQVSEPALPPMSETVETNEVKDAEVIDNTSE